MAARELLHRLSQLHPHSAPRSPVRFLPPHLPPSYKVRDFASSPASYCSSPSEGQSSGQPVSWLQKLKGFFVGQGESRGSQTAEELLPHSAPASSDAQFTLDVFANELKKARAFGKLTQFGRGLPRGGEAVAARSLERQEDILRRLATYSPDGQHLETEQKSEVATQCGCTVRDVDDVISKYEWAKEANDKMQKLKVEGKPLPKSLEEVEKMMGSRWKAVASVNLAKDLTPSRNSLCPCGSGKKYKRCVVNHPPYPWRPVR